MSEPNTAVFLSYASQDAAAARRICDALRAAGIEVWFDQSELRGGDVWDEQIRHQIRQCTLFIPVISAHTQVRLEGYFRREWRLAVERTRDMADGKAFLLPVLIDDSVGRDAHVPDAFRAVQWTRLPGGETSPAFAQRILQLLGRGAPVPAPSMSSPPSPGAGAEREAAAARPRRLRMPGLALLIGAVLIIALGYFTFDRFTPSRRAVEPTPEVPRAEDDAALRDRPAAPVVRTILITEFDNRTGEAVFDRILRRTAIIQLSQSPAFRIVSDDTIANTLKLMRKPAQTALSGQLGREACNREGADAVLLGEVDRAGRRYVLSMQALACRSGEHLASVSAQADEPGAILDAMSHAMSELRARLGESLRSVERYDRPVRGATTASLEAYQLFSTAADRWRFSPDASAAIPLFERAVQIDPQFALAYTYLGNLLGSLGETDRAIVAHRKAFELRDRVSERERLMITANYHSLVSGNLQEEIAANELWRAQYPHDFIPSTNLAFIYAYWFGDYARTLQLAEEALRLEPKSADAASSKASAYLALGDSAKARAALEDARRKGLDGFSIRVGLHEIAVLESDVALLVEQERWSANQAAQDNIEWVLLRSASQTGQLQKMRTMAERQARALYDGGFREEAASAHARAALRFASFGATQQALAHARQSEQWSAASSPRIVLASMYAQIGMADAAEKIIAQMERDGTDRSLYIRLEIARARALLLLKVGKPDAAIDMLEVRRRYDGTAFTFDTHYLRGLALLQSGDTRAAAGEFRWIIARRGIDPSSMTWALAHAQLARALATSGDLSQRRGAYDRILELWRNADGDLPLVQQIRTEAAHLGSKADPINGM